MSAPTPVAADETCAGTFEIPERNIIIGDGTNYAWDGATSGFGLPEVRNNDVDKGHGDGAVGQLDWYAKRTLTMPISIAPPTGTSPSRADLWQLWLDLKAAWARQGDGTDIIGEHVEVGFTTQYLGRPRGCVLNDIDWRAGRPLLRVLLTFECPDPTEY